MVDGQGKEGIINGKKKKINSFSRRWNVLVACDGCYTVKSKAQP